MIYAFLIVIHIIVCILMVLTILMQAAKGKGLAGAFGGSAIADTVLGTRGTATFLSRATTYLAIIFMVNCILLSLLSRGISSPRSAVQSAMQTQSPAENLPLVPGTMEQGTGAGGLPVSSQPQGGTEPLQTPESGGGK